MAQANRISYIQKCGGIICRRLHRCNRQPIPVTPHTFLEGNILWFPFHLLYQIFYQTPGSIPNLTEKLAEGEETWSTKKEILDWIING